MTSDGLYRLDGRVAMVTGASRGIGKATAVAMARAGASVLGVARPSSMSTLQTLEADIRALGGTFTAVPADLSTREGTQLAIAAADAHSVDVLFANAGVAHRAPAEVHDDAGWAEVLQVDLTSPFQLARAVGARLVDTGHGSIVFTASMMSFQGGRDVVSYAAAKSAISGVVHALANEWASRGVNVNAVAPGYIETDLTSATHGDSARRAAFTDRIPAGRWGTAEDVADVVVFLCSPAARYIHGAVIPVDGGWLVR